MKRKYKNINRFLIEQSIKKFAGEISKGENILDVGAGSGHYRRFFTDKDYTAIDRGIEQPDRQGLDVVGDIYFLPFKDAAFNNMICVEVLEHVWDSRKFFSELNRILKKDGKLLLTVPLCLGEHMQPYDFCRHTQFSLIRLLNDYGFKLLNITPRGGYYTLLAYMAARFPEHISSAIKIPFFFRRFLTRLSRIFFTYMVAPIFLKLDTLDEKKNFTLGYICEAIKISDYIPGGA